MTYPKLTVRYRDDAPVVEPPLDAEYDREKNEVTYYPTEWKFVPEDNLLALRYSLVGVSESAVGEDVRQSDEFFRAYIPLENVEYVTESN